MSFRAETVHALRWGTMALIAYLYLQTSLHVTVSVFVVLLNSTNAIGRALEAVASDAIDVSVGLAAVRKIALLLNAETKRRIKHSFHSLPPELPPKPLSLYTRFFNYICKKKKVLALTQSSVDTSQMKKNSQNNSTHATKVTDNAITLFGVEYCVLNAENNTYKKVLGPINLKIELGMVISLVDGHKHGGVGKGTLCQLLAGELIPSSGTCLIPRGAKTCRIPALPIMFDGESYV